MRVTPTMETHSTFNWSSSSMILSRASWWTSEWSQRHTLVKSNRWTWWLSQTILNMNYTQQWFQFPSRYIEHLTAPHQVVYKPLSLVIFWSQQARRLIAMVPSPLSISKLSQPIVAWQTQNPPFKSGMWLTVLRHQLKILLWHLLIQTNATSQRQKKIMRSNM